MKVFLEQSPFSYLSQFSPCRPSVLCHRSLTFPGVGIKWSILPPLSLPHSPSASAYLCSTFLGWALLVTSVQPHALLLTPAEHFPSGLSVLALAGKNYCSPYPSFKFLGSRYLCKRSPSFSASLVTDLSLFIGQLWHCRSYLFFFHVLTADALIFLYIVLVQQPCQASILFARAPWWYACLTLGRRRGKGRTFDWSVGRNGYASSWFGTEWFRRFTRRRTCHRKRRCEDCDLISWLMVLRFDNSSTILRCYWIF